MSPQSRPEPENRGKTEFEELGEGQQLSLVREFWLFITENKKWWMIPIVLVFALVGVVVALSSTGALPFIYTIF
jgi:Family of unknown function (DUF5989)